MHVCGAQVYASLVMSNTLCLGCFMVAVAVRRVSHDPEAYMVGERRWRGCCRQVWAKRADLFSVWRVLHEHVLKPKLKNTIQHYVVSSMYC